MFNRPFVDAGIPDNCLVDIAIVTEDVGLVGLVELWLEREGRTRADSLGCTVLLNLYGQVLTTRAAFRYHWQLFYFFFL